jgi:hypothetical protein
MLFLACICRRVATTPIPKSRMLVNTEGSRGAIFESILIGRRRSLQHLVFSAFREPCGIPDCPSPAVSIIAAPSLLSQIERWQYTTIVSRCRWTATFRSRENYRFDPLPNRRQSDLSFARKPPFRSISTRRQSGLSRVPFDLDIKMLQRIIGRGGGKLDRSRSLKTGPWNTVVNGIRSIPYLGTRPWPIAFTYPICDDDV